MRADHVKYYPTRTTLRKLTLDQIVIFQRLYTRDFSFMMSDYAAPEPVVSRGCLYFVGVDRSHYWTFNVVECQYLKTLITVDLKGSHLCMPSLLAI